VPTDQPRSAVQAAASPQGVIFTLTGAFDPATPGDLHTCLRQVLASNPARIIYDMTALSYIDYATIADLITAAGQLPGGKPIVRNPGPVPLRLLQASGLASQCIIQTTSHP
jgi:anti-anti-sigma regulatory factor